MINQTWSPMFDLVNVFETFLPQVGAWGGGGGGGGGRQRRGASRRSCLGWCLAAAAAAAAACVLARQGRVLQASTWAAV